MSDASLLLVTGATGYVGGQLIPRLLKKGYTVRVLVRDSSKLAGKSWSPKVQVSVGDVLEPDTLGPALSGVDVAYYLIHSMTGGPDFAQRDLTAARNFGQAAKAAGIKRVIYLGGLGTTSEKLSEHLRSRQEIGKELRRHDISVTEFRAAIIVGSGSISFEMIRHLTERIPMMICPRWVRTRVQPIAIEDVVSYLVASLQETRSEDEVFEIGGADVLTYGDLMKGYARVRGLRRLLLHVPVLTPRLSSYWVHWVTPISATYARPLIEGLRSEVVVVDRKAREYFSEIEPVDYNSAVKETLSCLDPESATCEDIIKEDAKSTFSRTKTQNGMIVETRQRVVSSQPEEVYGSFLKLGGANGWPLNTAWRLRALIDKVAGGVGMRRSKRERKELKVGDTVDFFRVVKVRPNSMVRLHVEMRLPGDGWLQFEARPIGDNLTAIVQNAFFAPRGLGGLVYWYVLHPFHKVIFDKMIKELAARS
ncbi:MAG: SDR family oxidoreductase [Planctomycetota bacterium]|jgi:uncharacterized protein YbjT (DUF2867 family)